MEGILYQMIELSVKNLQVQPQFCFKTIDVIEKQA